MWSLKICVNSQRKLREETTIKASTGRLPVALLCAVLILSFAATVSAATGDVSAVDGSSVSAVRAWARPALQGNHGAVYITLTNESDASVSLVAASADVAQTTEIHETVLLSELDQEDQEAALHDDHGHHDHHDHHDHHGHEAAPGDPGIFVMLHLEQLPLQPGETIVFEPAGHHIMLIDLKETLVWGMTFPMTLTFSDGSTVSVSVAVGDEPQP